MLLAFSTKSVDAPFSWHMSIIALLKNPSINTRYLKKHQHQPKSIKILGIIAQLRWPNRVQCLMCAPSLSRGYELAAEWRGCFFYHWFPFIIHLSMRFEWYLIIICCSISISILIESVHYSQKSGMRTYTHEILVVIGTVIISAQLLETFVWTCFFG